MESSSDTIIANGSLLFDLPDAFSIYKEEDGTIAAVPEATPDLFTLRLSVLTVTPSDPSQPIDLATHTIKEAASKGRVAFRSGEKAWLEEEKFSEENGAAIWLRFWVGGFRNDKFIISLCCATDATRHPVVVETCKNMAQVISTIRRRPETSPLTRLEAEYLDEQREVILEALRDRYDTFQPPKLRSDLPVIQRIIDDRIYAAEQVTNGPVWVSSSATSWLTSSICNGLFNPMNMASNQP